MQGLSTARRTVKLFVASVEMTVSVVGDEEEQATARTSNGKNKYGGSSLRSE
jgi:hypothetical protein